MTYTTHYADGSDKDPAVPRRETRVFAHAAAETQSVIYDSIVLASRPGTSVRPGTSSHTPSGDAGFLEVFPRVASRPPRLLSELETLLSDRLRTNDKAASLTPISGKEREVRVAGNLALDAHRQVFAAFALGFTTYTALLAGIQGEFEKSLSEGLRCSMENVGMRARIKEEEERRELAALQVRARILADELPLRINTSNQVMAIKERSARAMRRAGAAERELFDLKREEQRLRVACDAVREKNRKVQEVTSRDAKWAQGASSAPALSARIGPMTAEDEAFLEQELGSAAFSPLHTAAVAAAAAAAAADSSDATPDNARDLANASPAFNLEGREASVLSLTFSRRNSDGGGL